MYNCDQKDIIRLDANFDEEFDSTLINIISNCKRIYFLDQVGFGLKAKPSNSKFNKPVDILPEDITHIKFGYSFNHPVEVLPHKLEWLEFGYCFNQSVDMLPLTITYLVFGYSFNKPVFDLPNSIEYISFGKKFNQPINSLPNSIFYINIGLPEINHSTDFDQITYKLPSKLNNIVICLNNIKYPIKNNFVSELNNLIKNKQTINKQ